MNFQNLCLEIYESDPANFLFIPSLAWQAGLKKVKVKLDLSTAIDKLMVEKGIRGAICHSIYQYTKANQKYTKIAINIDKDMTS